MEIGDGGRDFCRFPIPPLLVHSTTSHLLCPAAPLEKSQKWVLEGGDEIVLRLRCPSSTWIATFCGLEHNFGIESGKLLKNGEMKEDVMKKKGITCVVLQTPWVG